MTAALCAGLDPDMWQPDNPGARLALMICARCDGCPDNDAAPHGVIRRGVPYSDTGKPLSICETCGYPLPGAGVGGFQGCTNCAVPPLSLFAADLKRWRSDGLSDSEAGARVGATARQVREFRRGRKVAA